MVLSSLVQTMLFIHAASLDRGLILPLLEEPACQRTLHFARIRSPIRRIQIRIKVRKAMCKNQEEREPTRRKQKGKRELRETEAVCQGTNLPKNQPFFLSWINFSLF